MTTIPDLDSFDLACSLSAAEQARRGQDFAHLFADALDVTELGDGYAFKFPNRDAWISRAVELVIAERKCCPFFGFTLAFEPDGGPVWLQVVGPGEVKALILEHMVPSQLRPSA